MAPALLEDAGALAHRLRGTAGTYGLEAASGALEGIEEQLGRLLEGADPDPRPIWSEIERLLRRERRGAGPTQRS